MSRRAKDAAASADLIRRSMRGKQREQDFHAAVPAIGAAALTAATAAVVMHPAFAGTRSGITEGLNTSVSDVMPGGDAFQTTMLRVTGAVLGGAAGAKTAFELAGASGATRGFASAPLAVVGGVACAFIGAEFAEPATIFGARFGKVVAKGKTGFTSDVAALVGRGNSERTKAFDGDTTVDAKQTKSAQKG